MAWIVVEMYLDTLPHSRVETVPRKRALPVPAEWV